MKAEDFKAIYGDGITAKFYAILSDSSFWGLSEIMDNVKLDWYDIDEINGGCLTPTVLTIFRRFWAVSNRVRKTDRQKRIFLYRRRFNRYSNRQHYTTASV